MKEEKAATTKEMKGMEESKGNESILPTESLWKDFDDWYKSIWSDFGRIDQEIDRRFKEYSDFMFKNRQRQLEDFRKESEKKPQLKASGETSQQLAKQQPTESQVGTLSHASYTKEHRQVETRAIQLGKYRILYKFIEQTKEKDGLILPHIVRQIDCSPAAPIDLLMENSPYEEELDSGKKRILSQFISDTNNVPDYQKPRRIIKFVNSIIQEDPHDQVKGKVFGLKVVYLNKDNERLRYYYKKR